MKGILLIMVSFLWVPVNAQTQDSLKNKTLGTGLGIIKFPEGAIYGFSHQYYFDYFFSEHFGAKLSIDFGNGQNNKKYYFDYSKSIVPGFGFIYAPLKNNRFLHISTSFSVFRNTRIFGTKDEILDANHAFSEYTSYEKLLFYGLNLGIQIPFIKRDRFVFTAKFDTWASWLKVDAYSLKLLAGYNF